MAFSSSSAPSSIVSCLQIGTQCSRIIEHSAVDGITAATKGSKDLFRQTSPMRADSSHWQLGLVGVSGCLAPTSLHLPRIPPLAVYAPLVVTLQISRASLDLKINRYSSPIERGTAICKRALHTLAVDDNLQGRLWQRIFSCLAWAPLPQRSNCEHYGKARP